MERWASVVHGAVFVCLCVEGLAVASDFGRRFMGTTVNGYLEAGDTVKFPAQLGCQGFLVIAEGRFVATRTRAWTQVREDAFDDVERLLKPLVGDSTAARRGLAHTGRVRLHGLQRAAELNGLEGVVVEAAASADRVSIKLDRDGTFLAVKPCNLLRVGPLDSVGHAAMDEDHDDLVAKIEAAYATPTTDTILALRQTFADHAAREEALLAAAQGGRAFSALDSHAADHARILDLAHTAAISQEVSLQAVQVVANAIYDHAAAFDALYAGKLSPSCS